MRRRLLFPAVISICVAACGDDGAGGKDADGGDGGESGDGGSGDGNDGDGTGGDDGTGTAGDGGDDGTGGDDGGQPPARVCDEPISLVDTSNPTTVIGSGDPSACTGAELAAAVSAGGVIAFDCGAMPVTIDITAQLEPPLDKDTVIDGGGTITLDGGDRSRILSFDSPDFRATTTKVTLQRLTLQNARAPANDFTPDPGNMCAWGYKDGAGGAVYVRDGVLDVIDVTFRNNHAASPGPDVGGGGIYAVGSLGVTVVGSTFSGNEGSNSGAVGLLQSTGTFVNTAFRNNQATGQGANYVEPGCPDFNHAEQGGAGGNGGAMAVDGVEETELYYCGCVFDGNSANELGGGVFRTPNGERRNTTFEQCLFDGNSAGGGGAMYISNSLLKLHASTLANNSATGLGGAVRTELNGELDMVNVTFYNNASTEGLAGALSHGGSGGGTIRNCTFAENKAEGGPGLFTAAIRGTSAAIHNTIFWNNTTMDPYNPMACDFDPAAGSNDFQWPRKRSDGSTDDTPCVTGIAWEDADLGPLQDNGGPTPTMIPAAAVVLGAGMDCPATDQRGQARADRQACAAGAVEP